MPPKFEVNSFIQKSADAENAKQRLNYSCPQVEKCRRLYLRDPELIWEVSPQMTFLSTKICTPSNKKGNVAKTQGAEEFECPVIDS